MKKIRLNKKTIALIGLILAVLLFFVIYENAFAMTHYQETGFVTGLVTASSLNVRSGPRTSVIK